jgi:short-subunit dehydrogenase
MDLKGRTVLVTGASSGIGAATARLFGARGAKVLLLARTQSKLDAVAQEVREAGGEPHVYPVDLGDAAAVEQTTAKIREELGVPDVVVNNAGAGIWKELDQTSAREAIEMTAVPYLAALGVTLPFLPDMVERGHGHIVSITSPSALAPFPGAGAYSVARMAMRGFHESLCEDLRGTAVRSSLVIAAEVDSPYFANNPGTAERLPTISKLIGNLTVDEVAGAMVRAVVHNRRVVHVPFRFRLAAAVYSVWPGIIRWFIRVTGWKRR